MEILFSKQEVQHLLHLALLRTLAIEPLNVAYGLSPTYLQEFVCFKDSSFYNFRYTDLLEIPRTKSTRYGTQQTVLYSRQL